MADIFNEAENTLIAGTDDADSIENYGNNVIINAFGGNDTIVNNGINTTIRGGDGNDSVFEAWWGAGMVYVYSGGDDIIDGGNDTNSYVIDGNWSLERNYDDYGTVQITVEGKGTLTLVNYSSEDVNIIDSDEKIKPYNIITNNEDEIKVTGKSGKDYIDNLGKNSALDARGGDDRIYNWSKGVSIDGGSGDDYIYNGGATVSIDGGKGDDSIDNFAANVTINGGAGNDYVSNVADNVTINGGNGENLISNEGNNIFFVHGGGNDFIYGFGENSTLDLDGKIFSLENDGENLTVYVDDNYIVLNGAATLENINVIGEYDDGDTKIINNDDNTIVTGTDDDDIIENYGSNVTIDAGAGNDYIFNEGSNVLFRYFGDGNDSIAGFGENSTLTIDDSFSTKIKGENLVVTVGKNKITLVGAANLENPNIRNSGCVIHPPIVNILMLLDSDKSPFKIDDDVTIVDASQRTKSVKIYANDLDNTIIGGAGNDKLFGEGGDDTFVYTGGKDIINDFEDGETISLASNYSSAEIKGGDVIFTFDDGTLTVKDAANKIITFADGTTFGGEISTTLTLTDADKSSVTLNSGVEIADASQRTKSIKIFGNDLDNTIIGGAGNDKLFGEGGNDLFVYTGGKDVINDYEIGDKISLASNYSSAEIKGGDVIFTFDDGTLTVKDAANKIINFADGTTFGGEISTTLTLTDADKSSVTLNSGVEIADASQRTKSIKIFGNDLDNTIIGGAGNDKLYGEGGNDLFVYTGGKDIINDYNYYSDGDKISLSTAYSDASIKGDDLIFIFDEKNSLTVKDAAKKAVTFADGTIYGENSAGEYQGFIGISNELIIGTKYSDTINVHGGSDDTINTLGGDDIIEIEFTDNALIQYATGDGNDSIVGFGENSTLQIDGEFSTKKRGKNIIVTVGDDKITLAGAASLDKLNIIGVGEEISTTLTLTDADKSSVTLNSGVEIADASQRTKAIKIYGNDLNNTIIGGAGNDKFWGEGGSDTFIYSDGGGKDSVYDFGDDDLLEIVGEFSASYKKSSGDVVFKVGDGSITLKETSATSFNVNGENYHISGTKLEK